MTAPRPAALLLDVQALQNPDYRDRGIGRYVLEHTRALLRTTDRIAGILLNPLRPAPRLPADLAASPLVTWRSAAPIAGLDPVVYHVMSPFEMDSPVESVLPPPGLPGGSRVAVTLYDLIPLTDPERYLPDRAASLSYRARLAQVRSADAILAISQYSADDAVLRLGIDPMRMHVIGAGVAASFVPGDGHDQIRRALPSLIRPYVLSVTGSHDRKNTEGLLDGYARVPAALRAGLQLVIACDAAPPWQDRWRAHAASVGLGGDEVVITGYVSDDLLRRLYQSARLFVFPSLAEGFGLPVAEAVACGCPTVTSNATSIPEILDWPDSTFDPTSADEIATLVTRALTDGAFRDELVRVGREAATRTTWDAVAERTLAAVDVGASSRSRPHRTRPLRLALAGPLPPIKSGVANYGRLLLGELAERCALDLFLEPGSDPAPFGGIVRRTLPLRRLGPLADPYSYDAVVYAIGNSVHHHGTLDSALRFPGVLWLHDVRLHRLVITWARSRFGDRWSAVVDAMIAAQYGPRVPSRRDEWWELDDEALYARLADHDVYFTRHLLAASRGAIVHSEAARRLVGLDQPAGASSPPVDVVPVTVPRPLPVPHEPAARPLVVSMGILHPVKSLDTVVEAAARLGRPVDVALVGAVAPDYRAELEQVAAAAGLSGTLHLPGAVDDAEYWSWLRRAWAVVQLRATWNGETSGAVNDAVAAGVPVATNLPSADAMAAAGAATVLGTAPTVADVAGWLEGVLVRPTGPSEHQVRYAADHSPAAVAEAVVASVSRMVTGSAGPSTTWR